MLADMQMQAGNGEVVVIVLGAGEVAGKLWYNRTITAASVVVAIFIGGMNDNLTHFGYAVVGIFIMSWIISTVIYRAKGYDNLPVAQA